MNSVPQVIERQWLWFYRKTRMMDFLLSGIPLLPGEPFAVEFMVEGLFTQLRVMAGPDVGFFYEGPLEAEPLVMPRDAVELLIYLALENALRFTSTGFIHVTHHPMKRWDRLTVRDTGAGLTPSQLDRLNDTLRRGPADVRSGNISGIPLSALVVRAFGGLMGIRSRSGQGTSVSLFFSKGSSSAQGTRQCHHHRYTGFPPLSKQGLPMACRHRQTL